ncbi:GtrA family protein [Patescibacteria group bacterium]
MKKIDALFGLIIGEVVSWFLMIIIKSLDQTIPYLWTLPIILPILSVIGLYVSYLISRKIPVFYQIAKFALIGFSNAAIDFGVLNLLMWQTGIYKGGFIIVFNVVAFIVAVINSYSWNKVWTFQSKGGNVKSEFIQFITIAVIGSAINTSIVYGVSTFVPPIFSPELWVNFAKVLATFFSMVWNFVGYKFIVFKK